MRPITWSDLDGTLTRLPAIEVRFILHLLLARKISLATYIKTFIIGANKTQFIRHKTYLQGLSTALVKEEANRWILRHLSSCLNQIGKRRLLEAGLSERSPDALITFCPDFLAIPIAKILGFSAVIAPRCLVSTQNTYTGDTDRTRPPWISKELAARRLAAALGVHLSSVRFYGNDISDFGLLGSTGQAYAVNPTRTLQAALRGYSRVQIIAVD